MELSSATDAFAELGVQVFALTYDSKAQNRKFSDQRSLAFPLLSDEGSATIRAFGLLNEGISPGSRYHGVPYPGIFVVDRNGIIRAKLAEESYKDRPPMADVLTAAQELENAE